LSTTTTTTTTTVLMKPNSSTLAVNNQYNHQLTASVSPLVKYKISVGLEEIKQHKWFISIQDWSDVYNRRLSPPFVPDLRFGGDTKNFENYDEQTIDTSSSKDPVANEHELNLFIDF
jgi:hypothetical protein